MSLRIMKQEFLEIVQRAYALAPLKSSLQILSNLKISCSEGRFEVTATDLDQSIRCSGTVEGDSSFEVAINARKLYDIVREIPDGLVTIDHDDSVLSLVSEKGFSCKVAGADVADFPVFPVVEDAVSLEIPVSDFRRTVSKSSFAVSKDTTRSCLCGVLWEIDSERCTMVSTDGHRLGQSTMERHTGIGEKLSVIISPKSLVHLTRIADSDNEDATLSVSVGEKYVVFSGERFTLCTKLIDGPYPDYEKVIPNNNPRNALVDRASLIMAVRRVSVLSNHKTHLVKFKFSPDTLEVTVLNRDIGGEAREVIPISYSGETHNIGFNGQYFSEILSIIETSTVQLQMNTQISACLILPWNQEIEAPVSNELFLIMPLRLMDEA